MKGRSKTKKRARDICKGTLDIEFERDWSFGLGSTLGDEQKIKNYFSSFRDFPGKADSVILLRFECTINPKNLIKIVTAIFEKMKILNFFLMWTTLNYGGRSKTKKWAKYTCRGTLDIECERNWPVGLDAMFGNGQKIKNYFSSFRDFSGENR